MLRLLCSLVLLLLALTPSFALDGGARQPAALEDGSADISIPTDAPRWSPRAGSLDEIIGDTLVIGRSYWDQQHNATVGRMIAWFPGDGVTPPTASMVFTKLYTDVTSDSRHVTFTQVINNEDGTFSVIRGGDADSGSNRSGYTTLALDPVTNSAYPSFHVRIGATGDDFNPVVGAESPFVPNYYNLAEAPPWGVRQHQWPHVVYGANGMVHMITFDKRLANTDPMEVLYSRWQYDPSLSSFTIATANEEQILVTDDGMNISGDIVTSRDGQNVAIAMLVDRGQTIGEIVDPAGTQWNNDIWLWESTDAGATWDWENPVEVTQHIGPDEDLFPDTTAAMGDTLRPHTDCSVVYDATGNLHVAFTEELYDALEDQGYYASRLYHWDRGSGMYTQINDHSFFDSENGQGQPEQWGNLVDRPSLYPDPDTGILWCVFRRIGEPPDSNDYGQGGTKMNGDIWVSASPPGEYNGLLWTEGVNITNTIWTQEGGAPPGESQSEIDVSVALRSDGDYLHILYMVDTDPGTGVDSNNPIGQILENPMVYHRVAKQTLLDMFEENAAWVVNYPMMVDSTGYWVDEYNWAWAEQGGFFRSGSSVEGDERLAPDQFDLEQNYPNPFNPSTNISFTLQASGRVQVVVHDILGREVATLLDRSLSAGRHSVRFLANDLPSGVYFCTLRSGEVRQTRKMVLMK